MHTTFLKILSALVSIFFIRNSTAATNNNENYIKSYDGALTCAALAYANTAAPGHENILWTNRGLMFGVMASRFYELAHGKKLSNGELSNLRDQYYLNLSQIPDHQVSLIKDNCKNFYKKIDDYCSSPNNNECIKKENTTTQTPFSAKDSVPLITNKSQLRELLKSQIEEDLKSKKKPNRPVFDSSKIEQTPSRPVFDNSKIEQTPNRPVFDTSKIEQTPSRPVFEKTDIKQSKVVFGFDDIYLGQSKKECPPDWGSKFDGHMITCSKFRGSFMSVSVRGLMFQIKENKITSIKVDLWRRDNLENWSDKLKEAYGAPVLYNKFNSQYFWVKRNKNNERIYIKTEKNTIIGNLVIK